MATSHNSAVSGPMSRGKIAKTPVKFPLSRRYTPDRYGVIQNNELANRDHHLLQSLSLTTHSKGNIIVHFSLQWHIDKDEGAEGSDEWHVMRDERTS